MKKQIGAIAIVAAISLFASTLEAQNRGERSGRGGDPEDVVKRMFENDANSDGKLSTDELGERGARMMDRADVNSDGFLTKDEITKMMESRGGMRRARGQQGGGRGRGPGGSGVGTSRMLAMFPVMKALDKDGNGELSEKEINNAVEALKTLDEDKNGKISTEEMMPDISQFDRAGRGQRGGGLDRVRPQRPERDDDTAGLKKGQAAPNFELKSLDGKTQTKLSDLYSSKPVVLFFGSYT